nr:uncharacterized protein LOC103451354 isoform X1 [Malus domestica]
MVVFFLKNFPSSGFPSIYGLCDFCCGCRSGLNSNRFFCLCDLKFFEERIRSNVYCCSRSCYSNFPVFLCGFPNSLSSSIILRDEYDLVKFIKLVQQASLFVNLQIGPYVCAEWNFGGFPVWLKYVSGIVFRRTMSLSREAVSNSRRSYNSFSER